MTRLNILLTVGFLLTSCSNRPIDTLDVCEAALEGVREAGQNSGLARQCRMDVASASYKAGHEAAKKYREMPRP